MLKITQISPRGQITIPAKLRDFLGMQQNGQVLLWPKIDSREIVIKPVTQQDLSELRGSVKAKKKPENWAQIRKTIKKNIAQKIATAA